MAEENAKIHDIMDIFPQIFAIIAKNNEQVREVDDLLSSIYKYPISTFNEILVNNEKLEQFEKQGLIALSVILHKVTGLEIINPTSFFSQKDINKALKYRFEDEDAISFPYAFEGVLRTSDKEYITVMSYKDIAKLWLSKILTYNFETQRASKKKINAKGEIKRTPTIIQKSVKNIVKLMKEGKFLPSTLVINILKDGTDSVEYENGDLIIDEGTKLNLIDGMHRMQGILAVLEELPDFEGSMEVSIRHYTLNEARYLIGLLNTVNRFDKNLVRFNTDDTFGGLIVKDLIQIKELKDRVETESTAVKKTLNMLTNYSVLSDSINITFNPETTKDQYDITDFLKKFYGYLIASYPDDFTKKMAESRKVSWINHHNMFVGWTVIAKGLFDKYGKDFPVDEITRIVDSLDLQKGTGSAIDKIMIEQGNRNSNQSKALIRKFFEEKVSELLS
ncbi:DNA sulfur modification protein DndB [Paenibacillus sp. FSL H7-0331]|uniref:DNA sulfur modification protein DndB n=1 Tax=Paenibacillus sp. FSL H7-0331 TaxID=1920421 RepID=UPI00096ED955|nr:DNA sulfur modification protein DndB [Paenibacillus sp. FSL H7-0331]OME97383.1 hypothetical protein BK127_40590 [Paenibacillus sp. FSL H7-0331]